MADTDLLIPFKYSGSGTVTLVDGAGSPVSLVVAFKQGTFTWSQPGRQYVEAMEVGRHASTVTLMETGDQNITGSASCLVTSFLGASNKHPYEFLTKTGECASLTSTAAGDKFAIDIKLAVSAGGVVQTLTFVKCVIDSVDIDMAGADGLCMLSWNFTSHANVPSIV